MGKFTQKFSIVLTIILVFSSLLTSSKYSIASTSYTRRIITLAGGWIMSSVALGDLTGNGIPDLVVGSNDGIIFAYRGDGTLLWQYDTGDATIMSKPALGDINQDGFNEVVVGIGSTYTPNAPGGVIALSHTGTLLWRYVSGDFNGDSIPDGVFASPALADVNGDGYLEIIYGGWDAYVRVLTHTGAVMWERFIRDTIWSSPAVADFDGDGDLDVVIGSDTHLEPAFGTIDGGRLLAFNAADGSTLPGFPINVDEVIWSSPVLADLDNDGWLDVIVGTGNCWTVPACAVPYGNTHPVTKALYAWDRFGNPLPGWPVLLPAYTSASPSVADLTQDGSLEVIVNTSDGYVRVYRADGTPLPGWPVLVTTPAGPGTVVHVPTEASPILADLTGDGVLEVIIPSNWEIVVFDRTGAQLTRDQFPSSKWDLSTEHSVHFTPAVGDVDGDGKVELVVGGARTGGTPGAIYIWDFDTDFQSASSWPYFRLNMHNTAHRMPSPRLKVSSTAINLMHKYGSAATLSFQFEIGSLTHETIDWSSVTPVSMTLMPGSGQVAETGQSVLATVSVEGLPISSTPYSLGNLELYGMANSVPVVNSPLRIPVRVLVVDEIYYNFLPLILRNR